MASPFPGMDPYLERPAFWPDFHSTFINYWREAIADALPSNYEVRLGEHVYLVEQDPEARKLAIPDLSNSQDSGGDIDPCKGGGVATLEPVTIPLTILDGPRETYIEILHRPDRRLVTTLELLSPTNKQEPGRLAYLDKRGAVLYQAVHLIELDLLLAGRRLPLRSAPPAADYYYLLSRGDFRPNCQVYYWNLRQSLPTLPVPLHAPDPDLFINLEAVFTTAYDKGRFRRSLAYHDPLPAPMQGEDRVWAAALGSKA